jgi:hypothetical protein
MVPEMYGDDLEGEDMAGLDRSEIMGDVGEDEILGDLLDGDELEGDDDSLGSEAFVGAAARRRRSKSSASKRAMARDLLRRRVQSGTLLRSVTPRSSREYALGLGSTAVSGNSSANINVQPQVIFRPERLVVPSNIAMDFLITDIKVGKNSQLVSTGALPAVMFTENAFGVRLKMDTAQISMFVTISVTNQNPNARNFQGGLVGPAVE